MPKLKWINSRRADRCVITFSFALLPLDTRNRNSITTYVLLTDDKVDWKATAQALKRQSFRDVRLTNLSYELLPTASRTSKYDPKVSGAKCPRCTLKEETIDHLLRCSSDAHQQ